MQDGISKLSNLILYIDGKYLTLHIKKSYSKNLYLAKFMFLNVDNNIRLLKLATDVCYMVDKRKS